MNSLNTFEQNDQNGAKLRHRTAPSPSPVKITELILAVPAREDDKKKEYADYIIENSGSLDQLKSSITFILKEIRENEKHN